MFFSIHKVEAKYKTEANYSDTLTSDGKHDRNGQREEKHGK